MQLAQMPDEDMFDTLLSADLFSNCISTIATGVLIWWRCLPWLFKSILQLTSFNLLFQEDFWTITSWILTFCDFQNFKNAAACSWVREPCFRLIWEVRKASSWLKSISADTMFRIKFSHLFNIASNCSLSRSEKSSWWRNSSVISDSSKYSLRAKPFSNPTMFLSAAAIFDSNLKKSRAVSLSHT